MKVYVCQAHHYDGGRILAVFDSLEKLKQYMKENNFSESRNYLIPSEVSEIEMNKSYQHLDRYDEVIRIPDKDLE